MKRFARLFAIVAFAGWGTLRADIVATDGSVPATMNAGGILANPAEYIIGYSGSGIVNTKTGSALILGDTTSDNSLLIQNASALYGTGGDIGRQIGSDRNTARVTGSGSVLDYGQAEHRIGALGNGNSLVIEQGAFLKAYQTVIGGGTSSNSALGSNNSLTIRTSGSVWMGFGLFVGAQGSGNTFTIASGGRVESSAGIIGIGNIADPTGGSNNAAFVTGEGSRWDMLGNIYFGRHPQNGQGGGSGNTLTLTDGGVATTTDTLIFSNLGASEENYIRLDGGYLALLGNKTTQIATFLADGRFQMWDGSVWVEATEEAGFAYGYYATAQEAEAFSGHADLAGYTIVKASAVPEPSTYALLALCGMGFLIFRRRRVI